MIQNFRGKGYTYTCNSEINIMVYIQGPAMDQQFSHFKSINLTLRVSMHVRLKIVPWQYSATALPYSKTPWTEIPCCSLTRYMSRVQHQGISEDLLIDLSEEKVLSVLHMWESSPVFLWLIKSDSWCRLRVHRFEKIISRRLSLFYLYQQTIFIYLFIWL